MTEDQHGLDDGELARLGALFGVVSNYLSTSDGSVELPRLVSFAAAVVPDAQYCGITLVVGRRHGETLAASDDVVRRVDALQYKLMEGPCLDASEQDDAVVSNDLATESRWPNFGPRCAALTGVHSMLSTGVALSGAERAALNFYAREPGAFQDLDVGVASILAPFAAIGVGGTVRDRDTASFTMALSASRQIGTAVGILMAMHGLTSAEAFERLREASQHLNRKIRDIAAEVEWTGELPQRRTPLPDPGQVVSPTPPGETA